MMNQGCQHQQYEREPCEVKKKQATAPEGERLNCTDCLVSTQRSLGTLAVHPYLARVMTLLLAHLEALHTITTGLQGLGH